MNPQLEGVESIPGTYPFDLRMSARAYRLNRFLWSIRDPAFREALKADPEAVYERMQLTEEERDLIRRRDWRGLIHHGACFFVLEKLGRIAGVSNAEMYAAMRGETLEEFVKTRNVPGAR